MAIDALHREESCGSHFRTEYQSPEQEALRDDKNFSHVSAGSRFQTANGKNTRKNSLLKKSLHLKEAINKDCAK